MRFYFFRGLVMILKKSLISGQATFEYFILFSVIIALSLVSLSVFYSGTFPSGQKGIRDIVQSNAANTGYAQRGIDAITTADTRY